MAITILELLAGDTAYLAKHNANYANIKAAVEALQAAIGSLGGTEATSLAVAYEALFGQADATIGYGSYYPSSSVAHQLTVAAGYSYDAATDSVVTKLTPSTLNFSGQTTGTYYLHVDQLGQPYFDAVPADSLFSVYYDQTTGGFSAIARVGPVLESAADQAGSRTNLWGVSYPDLDSRINGAEKAILYSLEKTAVSTDLTLTEQEAFEHQVLFIADGPQTANISLNVPAAERVYVIVNDASSSYTTTLTPSGGSGYAISGNTYGIYYCDGSTIEPLFELDRSLGASPATNFLALLDTPSAYTAQGLKLVRVNSGETALEFFSLPAYITSSGVTYEALFANGDVGTGADQVAQGNHSHSGYEPTLSNPVTDGSWLTSTIAGVRSWVARTFLNLTDTPSSYAGQALKRLRVNSGATAVEFVEDTYFFSGFLPGVSTDGAVMAVLISGDAVSLPAGLTGSYAKAEVAATGSATYNLYKNGDAIGSVDFAASSTVATFTFTGAVTFSAGDRLRVLAPTTADATLADISFLFKATR